MQNLLQQKECNSFLPSKDMVTRMDVHGPRYTSYPTADRFTEDYTHDVYVDTLQSMSLGCLFRPLALYVHIPFCESVCYYCACNKIVTKNKSKADEYLDYLEKEIALIVNKLPNIGSVCQLHLGGGTPTFLNDQQLQRLKMMLERSFKMTPQAERSIEVDPRTVSIDRLKVLRDLGFNRISFGVQDLDPLVQKAIHREHTLESIQTLMSNARSLGFVSINVDMIYGLPKQTPESFERTIDLLTSLRPDRVAVYSYAHLPERFKPQRRIKTSDLPEPEDRVNMLAIVIEKLTQHGWDYIGMDHFALPSDSLAVAKRQGRLHRNFQGYTTHADGDLIALGVSSISRIGASYAQNVRTIEEYYAALDNNHLPVFRGLMMSSDDLVRHSVIMSIMCQGEVVYESIELSYLISFKSYFKTELEKLEVFQNEGLVEITPEYIRVTAAGWFMIRGIAMVFDQYLQRQKTRAQFSKIL